jgi:DNA-binding GntR family transcriptional regulator
MTVTLGTPELRLGEAHLSLHGQVIEELRQSILNGRLKAGERLVEGRIAEALGVSRNPVREAIRVLASEGLIEVTARRGASVVSISEQEARETIEVRALLEGQNARLAARRQDQAILRRIEAVLAKGAEAVAANRNDQLTDLNQQFHRELAAAGQNRLLADLLKRLRERTAMLFSPNNPARRRRTWEEHADILRAIIKGDERAAATLAAEHVMRAGADFLATLNAPEEPYPLISPQGDRPKTKDRKSAAADVRPVGGKRKIEVAGAAHRKSKRKAV